MSTKPSTAPVALTTPAAPPLGTDPVNRTFTDNARKARYGVAYFRTICAQAGVSFTETSADEDNMAVDGLVTFARSSSRVQLKCTSGFKLKGASLTMTLDPGWVKSWTESEDIVYFVVVIVPKIIPDWISHPLTSTSHKTGAFWVRFDPAKYTDKIVVPKTQRLTLETLHEWKSDLDARLGLGATP